MDDVQRTPQELPVWPLAVLLVGYPVWWALGLSAAAVVASAAVMAALMVVRGGIRVTPGFAIWATFLVFVLGASVELDSGQRAAGFVVRYCNYLGSTVVLLYVYNARARLPDRLVFSLLGCFFASVDLGGWLGVAFPRSGIPTFVSHVLPTSLSSNELVHAMVHPRFAEVQQAYGAPAPIARPSAPFPYANSWGCNVAILVPLTVAAILATRSWRRRIAFGALLLLAAVPAAKTLNRGMFLALGVVAVYSACVYAWNRRAAAFGVLLGVVVAAFAISAVTGVFSAISLRVHYSNTDKSRWEIYREAWRGALQSPLFGHGAPRPSGLIDISVGTQGQIWNVMYSYGLPALVCFVGFFIYLAIRTFTLSGHTALWVHMMMVVVLITCVVYDFDGPELSVAMVGAAIALRSKSPPAGHVSGAALGEHSVDEPTDSANDFGNVTVIEPNG